MNRKKLTFRKETVRALTASGLAGAAGGGTSIRSAENNGCSTADEKCNLKSVYHTLCATDCNCGPGTYSQAGCL